LVAGSVRHNPLGLCRVEGCNRRRFGRATLDPGTEMIRPRIELSRLPPAEYRRW